MTDIPKQLRKIRREMEMSQDAVCACMWTSAPGWIANLEKGKISPTLATLTKWADALGHEIILKPKNAP